MQSIFFKILSFCVSFSAIRNIIWWNQFSFIACACSRDADFLLRWSHTTCVFQNPWASFLGSCVSYWAKNCWSLLVFAVINFKSISETIKTFVFRCAEHQTFWRCDMSRSSQYVKYRRAICIIANICKGKIFSWKFYLNYCIKTKYLSVSNNVGPSVVRCWDAHNFSTLPARTSIPQEKLSALDTKLWAASNA